MKRLFTILLFAACALCVTAQIQTAGKPYGFSATTALRSAPDNQFDFVDIKADTTVQVENSGTRDLFAGYVAACDFTMQNSGTSFYDNDGNFIWRMGLSSPGAEAMALVLDNFNIPQGAMLYVYDAEKTHYIGGFGAENNNPTQRLTIRPFDADSIVLEYVEPADAEFEGTFRVVKATHDVISPAGALRKTGTFQGSESCSRHVCTDPAMDAVARAVCLQYIIHEAKGAYSTGTLINNADKKPLIYTAGHNVKQTAPGEDLDIVCHFNYFVPALDTLKRGPGDCTMSGAVVLAKSASADFALLQLNSDPPKQYQPYLMGWDTADPPVGSAISPVFFFCIQHPNGDIKRFSYFAGNLVKSTFTEAGYETDGFWMVRSWTVGTTAQGSSGSPLIEGVTERIYGTLTGGGSSCTDRYSDFFSRFNLAYTYSEDPQQQLKAHLDPHDTGLTAMDGEDFYANNCTRETNMPSDAKPKAKATENSGDNYYAGHNTYGYTAYAERFMFNEKKLLRAVYLTQALGQSASSPSTVATLKICAGGDIPGEVLAEAPVLSFSSVGNFANRNAQCFVDLGKAVDVGDDFYVMLELTYDAPYNPYGLYYAENAAGTAIFRSAAGSWSSFSEHAEAQTAITLWVEPVVETNTNVAVNETPENSLSVSPNPSKGKLDVYGAEDGLSYSIYDMSGRLCGSGDGTSISLPETNGIYLLRLVSGNLNEIHKVIKN